jgi:hypothetical protein
MEFFDIKYCQALIEYNKSEELTYKIENIKNINNRYIRDLLRLEIELSYEKSEIIHKCKKYNLMIIKNLIDIYFIKKEIKTFNIDLNINYVTNDKLLPNTLLKKNINVSDIIDNIIENLLTQNNKKYNLSILKLQKIFNFKTNKKLKYIFNIYYNDLNNKIMLFYEKGQKDKNIIISNIRILLYKISQIPMKDQLSLDIISFIKNKIKQMNMKTKMELVIKKKNIQANKLKSHIEKNIKLYKKKQAEVNIKIRKIRWVFLGMSKSIKSNQFLIDKYKDSIILNQYKKKITNNMNKNYNKCKKFNKNEDIICSICQEQIEEGVVTSCNHTFHLECMNLYVNNIINKPVIDIICPMCRAYI